MTLAEFWPLCLLHLQRKMTAAQFAQWIAPVTVGEENGAWVVYGKNQFAANMLKSRFAAEIEAFRAENAPQAGAILFKAGIGTHYAPAEAGLMPSENSVSAAVSQSVEVQDKTLPEAERETEPETAAQAQSQAAVLSENAPVKAENAKPKSRKSAFDIVAKHAQAAADRVENDEAEPKTAKKEKITAPKPKSRDAEEGSRFKQTNLNVAYTFDNLAEGKGNQMAVAAAKAIAERPGGNYNPFFLYGSTGLGKTHLVQAIGNELLKKNPEAKVRYMHADEYIRSLMAAFRTNNYDAFKQQYRQYDLLIIDDIQFIKGKDRTMEEFFYLYNHFHENQKQLILTCDVLPRQIEEMDDRLKSRFSWGLTVELEPPEFEMRVAILQKKADSSKIYLPSDVADLIAHHVRSNVRELEGAFKQVEARAGFTGKKISIDLAREALQNVIASNQKIINADLILDMVAKHHGVKVSELVGKKRTRNIARPRQVAMSLMRELTSLSLQEVGHVLGGRDHSTVKHGLEAVAELRREDPAVDQDYEKLVKLIQN